MDSQPEQHNGEPDPLDRLLAAARWPEPRPGAFRRLQDHWQSLMSGESTSVPGINSAHPAYGSGRHTEHAGNTKITTVIDRPVLLTKLQQFNVPAGWRGIMHRAIQSAVAASAAIFVGLGVPRAMTSTSASYESSFARSCSWKVATAVGLFLACIASFAVYWSFEPKYEASALIEINEHSPYLIFEPHENVSTAYLRTQLELIRSRWIIGRAIDNESIKQIPESSSNRIDRMAEEIGESRADPWVEPLRDQVLLQQPGECRLGGQYGDRAIPDRAGRGRNESQQQDH